MKVFFSIDVTIVSFQDLFHRQFMAEDLMDSTCPSCHRNTVRRMSSISTQPHLDTAVILLKRYKMSHKGSKFMKILKENVTNVLPDDTINIG